MDNLKVGDIVVLKQDIVMNTSSGKIVAAKHDSVEIIKVHDNDTVDFIRVDPPEVIFTNISPDQL